MAFDIRTLAISKTGEMPVRSASGEKQYGDDGKPLTITLYSPGTKQYNEASHARALRNNDRMMSKMQGKVDGKQTADDAVEERAEFLTAITASFNNFGADFDAGGRKKIAETYADLELGHIADDADKFAAERANFIRPSTTSL